VRSCRIHYEFYLDILPACRNGAGTGSCIKVPDRAVRGWKDSNPIGYAEWFKARSRILLVERLLEKAAPVPAWGPVEKKRPLQLAVQLIKRWRDLYFRDPDLAPISVVLTTLAGHAYRGEPSVSRALTSILGGIVRFLESARRGDVRLRVWNPSNLAEDVSERWDENPSAYKAFEEGIRDFNRQWSRLVARDRNVHTELEALFGEPVKVVLLKRAKRLQDARTEGKLGVTSSGIITSAAAGAVPMLRNTFYGAE
jgi:hypothetical protein